MTTFTEGRRAAGFIISEANGSLSRDNGIVKAGEVLQAGEIVALDGSELVAWTDSDAAGVMLYPVNASSQAMPGAYLARQAEVNAELLVYPDDVEEADALAALAVRGIIAHPANIGAGGGGGGYVAPAVRFDGFNGGPSLLNSSLVANDNGKFSFAFWVYYDEPDDGANQGFTPSVWQTDPLDNYWGGDLYHNGPNPENNHYFFDSYASDYNNWFSVDTGIDLPSLVGPWHLICGSANFDALDAEKTGQALIDGVAYGPSLDFYGSTAFFPPFNGVPFGIACIAGTQAFSGGLSDFQFWCGQEIDWTDPANLAKVTAAGKPVDPAIAAAAFGQQTILFSGDHSTFASNSGDGGSFVIRKTYVSEAVSAGAGPKSISCPGLFAGQPVYFVGDTQTSADYSTSFESTISVNDQIQQTSTDDLGVSAIKVVSSGSLTNASTSPSD